MPDDRQPEEPSNKVLIQHYDEKFAARMLEFCQLPVTNETKAAFLLGIHQGLANLMGPVERTKTVAMAEFQKAREKINA